jgi:hypothetical protein
MPVFGRAIAAFERDAFTIGPDRERSSLAMLCVGPGETITRSDRTSIGSDPFVIEPIQLRIGAIMVIR